jgi:hypothetical protein
MTQPTPKQHDDSNKQGDSLNLFPTPSSILYKLVSRSPLLIGWNDDEFRKLLEDYREKRAKAKKELKDDEVDVDIEEVGFGLQGVISDAVKDYVYKQSNFDDLKSDLKRFEDSAKKDSDFNLTTASSSFNIREMKLYQNLLASVKYQRDAYIMGTDHAKLQKEQRDEFSKDSSLAFPFGTIMSTTQLTTYQQYLDKNPLIPQANTLASTQLTKLAAWFIPSQTMHNALLPTVLWTIAPPFTPPYNLPEGGPLRKQAVLSSSALIPLSQSLLDASMKNNIIWVLGDSSWRDSMKGTTRGMVGKMQIDEDDNSSASGRFVTTKTVSWDQ